MSHDISATSVHKKLEQYFRNFGKDLADAVTVRLPPEALELSLDITDEDRRAICLPIEGEDIDALVSMATLAHFGKGEDTVYDPSVRDTWLIDPNRVHLGGENWENHLGEALKALGRMLGIDVQAGLRAELHSMLVYGEGQFFHPHQDSEKDDSMLATLVVSLPIAHTGGELVIDDRGGDRTFRGDPNDIVLVAFYADRRHEVRPVTSGHRVTLTFNLLVDASPDNAPSVDIDLVKLLNEYYSTPVRPQFGNAEARPPHRLVFLLDHEYSQHGLGLAKLKGSDALRTSRLLSAAEAADCETALGLTEIHETREASIEDSHDYFGYGGWGDDWHDGPDEIHEDGPDDVLASDFETDGELLDGSIALGWWMDPRSGASEPIDSTVTEEEILTVTQTRLLKAHSAEFEGYMGNYGNTVDHWYRRAAVVIWPRSASFVVRAEAGSQWALRALQERIARGDVAGAAADARSLEPFWSGAGHSTFGLALEVAEGVDDPNAAQVVLVPYGIEEVTTEHATAIAPLTARYGTTWFRDLLESWAVRAPRRLSPGALAWIEWVKESLVPVVSTLRSESGASARDSAEVMVAHAATFVSEQVESAKRQRPPARAWMALEAVGSYIAQVIAGASAEQAERISGDLVAVDEPLVPLFVSILRSAPVPQAKNFTALVEKCRRRLEREADKPKRGDDDWSIPFAGCGCADCEQLGEFLSSTGQRTMGWPLAKPRRQHIHAMIDSQGLPVTHATERTGSPHKLKLHKTDRLMKEDAAERMFYETQLGWVHGLQKGNAKQS